MEILEREKVTHMPHLNNLNRAEASDLILSILNKIQGEIVNSLDLSNAKRILEENFDKEAWIRFQKLKNSLNKEH